LQAEPEAAMGFYRELFGWEFAGPGPMPGEPPGHYFVARHRGRDVAGVGSQPAPDVPPSWSTHISVTSVEEAADRARVAGGTVLAGPFDAPPAGRAAVLGDPAGAAFCVWEAQVRQGAQLINEPSAWAMSVLHSSDQAAANEFYSEMFGWRAEPVPMGGQEMSLWRLPGYVGGEPHQPVPRDVVAVMVPAAGEGSGSHWSVGFWIDDADWAAERAAELGGSVIVAPHDTPGFRNTVLADPGGAVFSVSKLVIA
jgi:predicted enzyme related to lactoylglutathione lyase